MESGIEVSDPRRTLRALVIGVVAVVILLVSVGALVALPMLQRADRALDALEQVLPVVEEQIAPDVAALGSDVNGMPADLDAMLVALQETRDGVTEVGGSVDETNAGVQTLLERFDRMLVLLGEIEEHVESMDRKTGPVVAPDPGDVDG